MQRSTEATLDWSQWREKLGIDLYECSINILVSLPNEHLAVAPRLRACCKWILPDVQLLQVCELVDGLWEAAQLVGVQLQNLQHRELADGLREAGKLVGVQIQNRQHRELADGLREAADLVVDQGQPLQRGEFANSIWEFIKYAISDD